MTVQERIDALGNAPGVLAAYQYGDAQSIGGGLDAVTVAWLSGTGDVARRGGGTLIVSDLGGQEESALWGGELPAPLVPAPAAPGYITERTVPYALADVVAFANAQWRGQGGDYTNAPDILGVEIDNLDGKSVRVGGLFWMADGSRSDRAYVIRLVDPNGEPTGDNVKLERIQ